MNRSNADEIIVVARGHRQLRILVAQVTHPAIGDPNHLTSQR
jgi:hypothetical protein